MLPSWLLFLISSGYVGLLFAIAYWGDRRAERQGAVRAKPWTYSLALAVYCTSWTFYGAVGRAAQSGWDFLPIYLGPTLVFLLGMPLISRVVKVSRRHNLTSVADFIGARYGRRQELAGLVALIAVVGILPYLALQLKAAAFSLNVLAIPEAHQPWPLEDSALITAALLAVFAILFGTRTVAASENHHGMVLAIAFESVVKLLAFFAVGLFVCYGVFNGIGDAYSVASSLPVVESGLSQPSWFAGFLAQTVLAMAAILCLPRQFHVTVVENSDVRDLATARWLFPLYLVLISVFVMPIAAAGATLFGSTGVAPDTYVLNVPLHLQHDTLALFAYIGGFSATTSMVIVETVALSTMLSNEIVMPLLLRSRLGQARSDDLSGLIKSVRRLAIVGLLALAYFYNRNFTGSGTLSSLGLLSFAAVLQFAPALVGGVYWRRGSHRGVLAGLVLGFGVWGYSLMLPAIVGLDSSFVTNGPWGIAWLKPHAFFGIPVFDPITHGSLMSLLMNLAGYIGGSLWFTPGLRERLHAARYVDESDEKPAPERGVAPSATVGDLTDLLERFFGATRTAELLGEYAQQNVATRGLEPRDRASPDLIRHTERLLAGALGASSARVVLASMLRGRDMQVEDVIQLLDETSHALQFSRELLQAALEHLSQGVSVVDGELRLVAWNRRYVDLFEYPAELVRVGTPIEELFRHNARRGLLGPGDVEELVRRRLAHMRAGTAYSHERALPGGTVIEIRGNPMPGGGFVTSYAEVTAYKLAESRLQELADTLEQRVRERTEELSALNAQLAQAKGDADRANAAKTRFLAAATHDLVQPISAAKLFLAAFDRRGKPAAMVSLLQNVETALQTAEKLLAGLLDISVLDSGAQPVQRRDFPLAQVLEPLATEFTALARERGLEFHFVPSKAIARTDPALLRRVLQNLLANALRYTDKGGVLLGVRREGANLRLTVVDTGPGIPADRHGEIFEEFRRLNPKQASGDRGMGLGLAIVDRIARLLGHRVALRSVPGKGSAFSISVPRGNAAAVVKDRTRSEPSVSYEGSPLVLCIENEPAVLDGMEALLRSWGCRVIGASGFEAAQARWSEGHEVPDVALVDYHLDGANGIDALEKLRKLWGVDVPGVVITADHTPEARAAATAHGYGFLQKPMKPAALRAILNRLVLQAASG